MTTRSAGFLIGLLLASCAALPGIGAAQSGGTPADGAQASAGATAIVPEPDDYRRDEYRAPTPSSIEGGTLVDTAEAKALHDAGVPFVDVMPRPPRPNGLPEGTLWRPKPRDDIPGSVWLVDTGYGDLAPVMERYLLDGLDALVGGDRSRPIVIYCERDCWMSYNASKRAARAGFTGIRWYPDGAVGWSEAGYPLERTEPKDRPDEARPPVPSDADAAPQTR